MKEEKKYREYIKRLRGADRPAHSAAPQKNDFRKLIRDNLAALDRSLDNLKKEPVPALQPQPLSKGKFQPELKIDLHNYTLQKALAVLESRISAAAKRCNNMLVITGKGIHSSAGPVLKDEVKHFLHNHSLVCRVKQAPRRLGGSGALIAYFSSGK
ncbi:MAG TPA: Smr/MutS family protein [Spirochaetota bacterium]|nr:Smr/MutS family protein [Spirochaetota bacterium]